jgi:putative MATE family efflux protein
MRQENNLGEDSIGRLVLRIALPSMLAQFVNVLYSIVDRMYIGNIPEIGSLALAGVGVCGPVVTMVSSAASLVGIGGAPLMSICMGEQNLKKAKAIMANCFLMLVVVSGAVMAGLYPIREPMLSFFGASEATMPFARRYFSIYLAGTPFALLAVGMNQFIICQGYAKKAMFTVIIGAVINIVLDPILIFAFDMGVAGAAVATVLSQFFSCCFVIGFLFSKQPTVQISFGGYSRGIMGRVLAIGFTPFAIIAVDNVMIIAMNAVLQKYGGPGQGDLLVTCATIAQSFMLIVTMPLGGISGGTQTILGYNYGACQIDRVEKAQRKIILLCLAYTGLMTAAAWLGGAWFVRLFTDDPAIESKALWALRVCTLSLLPLGIQYEIVDGFTAIGQVRFSLLLSFWRKLVYFAALFILPAIFGAETAFYAEPISDFLGPAVSIAVYFLFMKRVLQERLAQKEFLEVH